ncbi:MAG: hypothetical protein DMG06_21110 [Acidobacteria bacterium]|nr:MAG: hypothetical protein DMG06_21110 [Acidobacteriota bacterium]
MVENRQMLFSTRRLIAVILFSYLFALPVLLADSQDSPSIYDQVTKLFQQGKTAEAEQVLRSILRKQPGQFQALALLGVVLDAQKRYEEAEGCYTQALKLAPNSAALHNNLGNHYLARGMPERAQKAFLRVVAIDPHHSNANLQLAQMSVARTQGRQALQYLDHLPESEQKAPAVQLLRAQALYRSGQPTPAEALLAQLERTASRDPRLAFSIGMIFVDWERFQDAERTFSLALEADPTNFDILYNLGLAATRADHLDRARDVFEVAIRQRPEDVDCLYGLARVHAQQKRYDLATALLLRAQRLAPSRTDILLFLAHSSEKLGYYGDTAVAYDQYLKLKSDDDVARRERGFALARSGKVKDGLRDLEWYVQKYPRDAEGLYQLAVVEMGGEREKAFQHLTQALECKPDLLAARFARALFQYQEGRAAEAIQDLKPILLQEPNNVRVLDQLGQSYLLLDQPQAASQALSRAFELAPKDPTILIHYGRALRKLGHQGEANQMLAKFKETGPDQGRARARSGLFDYLNLSPEQQKAQYLANVQRTLAANPNDPALKLRLGVALLSEGKVAEALEHFRQIREFTSDSKILTECGRALLDFQQYEAARSYLLSALDSEPLATGIRLDLALATFHAGGPEAGLHELDKIPARERDGDYFLLRAQILDALSRPSEAGEALNQGFKAAPTRADLYFQAALFLIKHDKNSEALDLLRQAERVVPDAPELLLVQAVLLEILKQPEDAKKLLAKLQSRWPEWELPYLIQGIILEIHLFSDEAKTTLETAIALGANDPAAYYFLALATTHSTPNDMVAVQKAVSQALELSPEDPYIRSLAGKNALSRKDYAAAIEHLTTALRYKPDLVEARYALSAAYRATGDSQSFATELKEAQRLEKENPPEDPVPSPVRQLLFTVRPPGHL